MEKINGYTTILYIIQKPINIPIKKNKYNKHFKNVKIIKKITEINKVMIGDGINKKNSRFVATIALKID